MKILIIMLYTQLGLDTCVPVRLWHCGSFWKLKLQMQALLMKRKVELNTKNMQSVFTSRDESDRILCVCVCVSDPEEFLNKLFQLLRVEPLLKIR